MAGLKIVDSSIVVLRPSARKISGVVRLDETPVGRRVVVMTKDGAVVGTSMSNQSTGAYEIVVGGNVNDRYVVVAIGLDGESADVAGGVVGVE